MRTLIFAVLLGACHKEPAIDRAELERLRAEQRALAARVEALQAQIDRVPTSTSPLAPAVAPPVPPPPDVPRARPLLTNIDTSESGAVVTTKAPPSVAGTSPTGSLHTEDLHGAPIGGAASPLGGGGPIGLSAGGGSVSDAEGAAMLDQLQAQMKQLKGSQAAEQSALDQLEKMR